MLIIKNPKTLIKSGHFVTQDGKVSKCHDLESPDTLVSLDDRQLIAPGFINLHCHLAYSDLQIPKQDLFSWIFELVNTQKTKNLDFKTSSLNGAKEAISFGTTFLVDNTMHVEESINAFLETGLKGLIGLEVFGSEPDNAHEVFEKQLETMRESLTNLLGARAGSSRGSQNQSQHKLQTNSATGPSSAVPLKISETFPPPSQILLCFSPHAPYDVSKKLWKLLLNFSKESNVPLLSHAAESDEEENWFKSKNAPNARKFWESIGTYDAKEKNWKPYQGSVDYLYREALMDENTLLTHLVKASEEDLKLIKEKNVPIVTCPRSNEYLENGSANIELWEKLGIKYGVGTDSKASNYDLDLRKEVNKLNLSAQRKLELLTTEAAKILNKKLGTLDEGMPADYTVFELDPSINLETVDPLELLFDTEKCKVKEVYINGEKVYESLVESGIEA